MQNSQKKIAQSRPPRIQISYEVETEGAIEVKELPFVVGVLGDFAADGGKVDSQGNTVNYPNTKFTEIDAGNFNEVMEKMNPVLKDLKVPLVERDNPKQEPYPNSTALVAEQISFQSVDDFHPDNIISNTAAPHDNPDAKPLNSIYYAVSPDGKTQENVPLNDLIEMRSDLQSLIDLIQRSPAIEELLFDPDNGVITPDKNKKPDGSTSYSLSPDFVQAIQKATASDQPAEDEST